MSVLKSLLIPQGSPGQPRADVSWEGVFAVGAEVAVYKRTLLGCDRDSRKQLGDEGEQRGKRLMLWMILSLKSELLHPCLPPSCPALPPSWSLASLPRGLGEQLVSEGLIRA